jgi:BON domain
MPKLRFTLAAALLIASTTPAPAHAQEPRKNVFDDPFAQATSSIKNCPAPQPPGFTEAEIAREAHIRVEKGTTCWYRGRCLLPNAYKYDKLINEAVVRAITVRPEFAATSVWVASERRIVYLKGCVASAEQKKALVAVAGETETVDAVIDQLMVGSEGTPPYKTDKPAAPQGKR